MPAAPSRSRVPTNGERSIEDTLAWVFVNEFAIAASAFRDLFDARCSTSVARAGKTIVEAHYNSGYC